MTIFRYKHNCEFSESEDDCEAEHNRLVRQKSSLRTVKKAEGSLVMILAGEFKGQPGEMLWKDKKKCKAAVQVLPDKDDVVELDFDDLCEYVDNY